MFFKEPVLFIITLLNYIEAASIHLMCRAECCLSGLSETTEDSWGNSKSRW